MEVFTLFKNLQGKVNANQPVYPNTIIIFLVIKLPHRPLLIVGKGKGIVWFIIECYPTLTIDNVRDGHHINHNLKSS